MSKKTSTNIYMNNKNFNEREEKEVLKWWQAWGEDLTPADFPDEFFYSGKLVTNVSKFIKNLNKRTKNGKRPTFAEMKRLMVVNNRHIKRGKNRRI